MIRILYPRAFVVCHGEIADLTGLPAGTGAMMGEITAPFRPMPDERSDRQYIHDLLDDWLDRHGVPALAAPTNAR